MFGRADSSLDQSKESRKKGNNCAPGQTMTGKKANSSNVNFERHNKSNLFPLFTSRFIAHAYAFFSADCTFTSDLKGSDRKDAVDDVEISMTVLDTTTNLVTNVESINEFELLESLMVTSVNCNGIYANRVLSSGAQIIDTEKL